MAGQQLDGLCGLALIVACGMVQLARLLAGLAGPAAGWLTAVALWFGAAPLPYATMLFSHALVVACLAVALWALSQVRPEHMGLRPDATAARCPGRWLILTGFALGWALASEYSSGLVVLGLLVFGVGKRWPDYRWILLGMSGPVVLIPMYSWLTMGKPWVLPYSYHAVIPEMQRGLYGIEWPDARTAFHLLFSLERGLLFWSPFLVMAGFGYRRLFERSPRLFWLTYLVPLLQLVVISGRSWGWHAGPTLGPRLLSPMLPLLALPCAMGVARWPRLGLALAVYSMAITTLATLTDACPELHAHPNPLLDLHLPLLGKGEFSPNLGMVLGLSPYASVALYYALLVGGAVGLWRRLRPYA